MNVQAQLLAHFNLDELPYGAPPPLGAASNLDAYEQAAQALRNAHRVIVRLGGGSCALGTELLEFLELVDGVAVTAPQALGVIPYDHPRNMTVGGSKGSLCGNYAMENADLLVAIGTRAVCQADCSRTGYPLVERVININTEIEAVLHYNKTIALLGDAAPTLAMLNQALGRLGPIAATTQPSEWLASCSEKRRAWRSFKQKRYDCPTLYDETWKREVLTQPAAIKAALDWARLRQVVSFFDAGDVQANAFQIAENTRYGQTISDTGASYMGFAASALLATALAKQPFYGLAFSGDGSFTMSPQILIDGVEHGAQGCLLVFDNRRMAAISGLQNDQYGHAFATNDSVAVDYVAWGRAIAGVNALHAGYTVETLLAALEQARAFPGLSLIHLPVYSGPDELGGMGVFGRWNVGNWSVQTQALRHQIGL
jgi:3D-(3,5/4)-trihydroxycyclohexane-1,2-dione acylhydrolase (decyclizing)